MRPNTQSIQYNRLTFGCVRMAFVEYTPSGLVFSPLAFCPGWSCSVLKRTGERGWRGDSVIKSTGCFSRGPRFSSQHPWWLTTDYLHSQQNQWLFLAYAGLAQCTQTDMQGKHPFTQSKNEEKRKNRLGIQNSPHPVVPMSMDGFLLFWSLWRQEADATWGNYSLSCPCPGHSTELQTCLRNNVLPGSGGARL